MKFLRRSLFMTSATLVAVAMPARADLILDWNTQAQNAIQANSIEAPEAARDLAILSTSIYDAVNGIDGGYTSYLASDTGGPSGASLQAAAAAAANTVMAALYPAMGSSFTTLYNDQLSSISDGQSKTDGINWGNQVATAILNARAGDGASNAASTAYNPSGQIGRWAATPPAYQYNPTLPGWVDVVPFGITQGNQFRPATTLDTTSVAYANSFNQVQSLGDVNSTTRTTAQTTAAYAWSTPVGTVTAAGQWNRVATQIIQSSGLDLRTQARVLATLNISLADAAISAWDASYANDNWRPVTAIAYGGNAATDYDGNPLTTGSTDDNPWNPLVNTPAMPSSMNPNAAMAAAAVKILMAYFGNHAVQVQVDTNGDGIDDTVMTYASLTDALNDAGLAAVWGGTDFSYATDAGLTAGDQVGTFDINNYFLPVAQVPEPSGLLLVLGAMMAVRRRRRAVS